MYDSIAILQSFTSLFSIFICRYGTYMIRYDTPTELMTYRKTLWKVNFYNHINYLLWNFFFNYLLYIIIFCISYNQKWIHFSFIFILCGTILLTKCLIARQFRWPISFLWLIISLLFAEIGGIDTARQSPWRHQFDWF